MFDLSETIPDPDFVRRKQDASMFGQFCAAQEGLIAGTGRRSAFARACGGSAARGGAKLGRIVIAAAMKAAIVTAASALIIVRFPVDAARRPLVRMTRDRGQKFTRS